MAAPVLSYAGLRGALISLLVEGDTGFKDRSLYVGASEVGGCPRLVSFRKALGAAWVPDAEAAGVMLPGKLAETFGISLLRKLGLGEDVLTSVGESQEELQDGNLRAHPDGLLASGAFILDTGTAYYTASGAVWKPEEARAILQGPGILEFKSGSSSVFRSAVKDGLSPTYQDQIQSNMGLSGRAWTLLVFICRDSFSKVALFLVPFSEPRYRECQRRADAILGAASLARQALVDADLPREAWDPEDSGVHGLVADALLEEDPERGYCQKCPLRHSCKAMVRTVSDATFPESVAPEVEALAMIVKEAGEAKKAAEEDCEAAKDRLKELSEQYGANFLSLPKPYKTLKIRSQKGRETVVLARLRSDFPAAAEACVTRGDDFLVVDIR